MALHFRRGACLTVALVFMAAIPRAEAFEVTYGDPPVTVEDNLAGDLDPAVGTIQFGPTPFVLGYSVAGTVIESISPAGATHTLTDCIVERTGAGGAIDVFLATASTFAPISPPSDCALNIDGLFVDAGAPANVGVTMGGLTNLGPIAILGPFGSPPLTFSGTTGAVAKGSDVTSFEMRLTFRLTDVGDMVVLPTSAHLSMGELGACCDLSTGNCFQLTQSVCESLSSNHRFHGVGTACGENGQCIPTMSTWGLGVLGLLVATAGTLVATRRRAESV